MDYVELDCGVSSFNSWVNSSEILGSSDEESSLMDDEDTDDSSLLSSSDDESSPGTDTGNSEQEILVAQLLKDCDGLNKYSDEETSGLVCLMAQLGDQVPPIIKWLKESAVLDKYDTAHNVSLLMKEIVNLGNSAVEVTDWLLTSGTLENYRYWYQINMLVHSYGKYDSRTFMYLLSVPGLMNKDILKQLLSIYAKEEVNGVLPLLSNDKPLPVILDWIPLYLAVWGSTLDQGRVKQVLEDAITTRPVYRGWILLAIKKLWGIEDLKTQHFFQFAIGCDHTKAPDSFVAVTQEMLNKRQEPVVHYPQSGIHSLNVDVVREPRPIFSIHMPINAWENLFLLLEQDLDLQKKINPEVPFDDLLTLKGDPTLLSLLDPKDHLQPRQDICTYSHMFRMVLEYIQSYVNRDNKRYIFVQFLNDILGSYTGKLNGVLESYKKLNQCINLNQPVGVFEKIINLWIKEELSRYKEVSLSALIIGLEGDEANAHDLHYLRSVIGNEIGLILENEELYIDSYADVVNSELRQRSKQELLNLFYQHYTVDNIVGGIQIMLNESVEGNGPLILAILDKYLVGEEYESLIKQDENGQPIEFTEVAVVKFLKLMGILE